MQVAQESGAVACLRCQLCDQVLEVFRLSFCYLVLLLQHSRSLDAHFKMVNIEGDKPDITGA